MFDDISGGLRHVQVSDAATVSVQADECVELSPRIAGLLATGVVAAESCGPGNPLQLHESERRQVAGAPPVRVREFAAGRVCAHRALEVRGISDYALLRSADRRLHWPAEIVGSLTRAADFCAAVIGPNNRFAGLGLDMEGIEPVTEALWPRVCVAPELRWLPKAERESAATLVFSAKTAFYKCLYTVSRAWLVFSDMQIDIDGSDLSAGRFVIGVVDPQY